MWEIEGTDQFADWFGGLPARDQEAIDIALEVLASDGPGLGRPLVDSTKTSRHVHMKEVRPLETNIRRSSACGYPLAGRRQDWPMGQVVSDGDSRC